MRDLQHRMAVGISAQATITANNNGAGVDTLGYESVTLLQQVAAIGGTTPSYTPKIQVSADNTTFFDLDAAAYMGGVAPAAITANGQLLIGIAQMVSAAAATGGIPVTSLRYVRAVNTVTGTSPTASVFAAFILAFPRHSGVAV